MPPSDIARRVVGRFHLREARAFFEVGDPILFGKYKNKKGIIRRLFLDDKGHPTMEVEPVPKGRKKNKLIGLFKVWHAPPLGSPGHSSPDSKVSFDGGDGEDGEDGEDE